jgi:hypothetical protein
MQGEKLVEAMIRLTNLAPDPASMPAVKADGMAVTMR